MDFTNKDRAQHGARAVEVGTPDFGQNSENGELSQTDLVDTLANLMHYARANRLNFASAVLSAGDHFEAEACMTLNCTNDKDDDSDEYCEPCKVTLGVFATQSVCVLGLALRLTTFGSVSQATARGLGMHDQTQQEGTPMTESNIKPFARPVKPAGRMMRVIDITSPFFAWEGWICNTLPRDGEAQQYVQIMCAHSGFQFPPLTFATYQITDALVKQ